MQRRYAAGDRVVLGGREGVIVDGQKTAQGQYAFTTSAGVVQGRALKATGPEVALDGAQVWLIEEGATPGGSGRYAVMVEDWYWGVRVEPAAFVAAPITADLVMGYRLEGQVLRDGVPEAGAKVSLEVTLETREDGEVVLWDSEEYNELVYSESLDTWVEGPRVLTPIQADATGCWKTIVPKGDGAVYQRFSDRRDGSEETAQKALPRWVKGTNVMYLGHRAPVSEGSPAVINLASGTLRVTATPGAYLRIGTMDDAGEVYGVPESGQVTVSGLPHSDHTVVQFRRNAWGDWDPGWGCARRVVEVQQGTETELLMPPLEAYDPGGETVCGRVYERAGVPASGLSVVIVDMEKCQVVGSAATTNSEGYWTATIPTEGFGGELCIHDPTWGSVPVLGWPYSDLVLGARAYSSWDDTYRPEAWRKGSFGHKNFPYVRGALWVEDAETGEKFEVEEASYGGWVTKATLPKYRYVADVGQLVNQGTVVRSYNVVEEEGLLESGFTLGSQPFEDYESSPGQFRAAGHYPEAKWLIGGKLQGNVVLDSEDRIDEQEPEAARVGLEFGKVHLFVEMRAGKAEGTCDWTNIAGFVCPYCGGPAYRDPDSGQGRQGYCANCAEAFDNPQAMDCRSYFRSPTVMAGHYRQRGVAQTASGVLQRGARYHWRPDLYEESAGFLTQTGTGQPTNAPRWCAVHPEELGDGLGLGRFYADGSPQFVAGHDLNYYSGLTETGHEVGLAQLKLVFDAGYQVPEEFALDVDAVRWDGTLERVRVVVPAGMRGPCAEVPFGEVVRLRSTARMKAELVSAPYPGSGLYRGVADMRLASAGPASGCRCKVTADGPYLASPVGVKVENRVGTPVALQLDRAWGNPDLTEDQFGEIFVAYTREGNIELRRRGGLSGTWEEAQVMAGDGTSDYADVAKNGQGTLLVAYERDGQETVLVQSRDDGQEVE